MSSITRTADPAKEPVTLAAVRSHLRLDDDSEDVHVAELIAAAREWCEGYTRRSLITQTWEYRRDSFPSYAMAIPRPPLQSVTSIQYIDDAGDLQTLSSSLYTVDTDSDPGIVHPIYGETWPPTQLIPNAVIVTFVAGYGEQPTDVPADLRHALKLNVSRRFDFREPLVVGTTVDDTQADAMLARPYLIPYF